MADLHTREELVPSDVRTFVTKLNRALLKRDVDGLGELYEDDLNKITQGLFSASRWPSAEAISAIVKQSDTFMLLYKEMYNRHIRARLGEAVSIFDRFDSFQNYLDLFNIILGLTTDAPELELPGQWMWDIVDEFIEQFQSFHLFRSAVSRLSPEEEVDLRENPHAWSGQTVILYLQYLVSKGGIRGVEGAADGPPGEVASMFRRLGEYSLIGLVRVMCLLGDYTSALDLLKALDWSDQAKMDRPLTAHAALYYHTSFACLMLRRYGDATSTVSEGILYYSRHKAELSTPHHKFQASLISEKVNQMYGTLAIALACSPNTPLDEAIQSGIWKENRLADKSLSLAQGELGVLDELFGLCAPKFITASPPDYARKIDTDAYGLQLRVLQAEFGQRTRLQDVYSYLKMCSSISLEKLASFLKVDAQTLALYLMNTKHKRRCKKRVSSAEGVKDVWTSEAVVDFSVDKDMVQVAERSTPRRYGEHFMAQINNFETLLDDIHNS